MSNDIDFAEELIALFISEWNPASTDYGQVPAIRGGWLEDDDFDTPSVRILGSTDVPLGGGDTGFTGMRGDGRPMTRFSGDQPVMCVTHALMHDLGGNPKAVSKQMKNEVRRIVSKNYLEPFEGIHLMSFFSSSELTDNTRRPIWFRNDCLVRYIFDHRLP